MKSTMFIFFMFMCSYVFPNVPGAIVGVITGVEKFLEAADKYCENVEFEAIRESKDIWDLDY